jgi:hypothetical protein
MECLINICFTVYAHSIYSRSRGGVDPLLPPFDPFPFFPRLFLRFPSPPLCEAPPRGLVMLDGLELVVETMDSAGELAPDSWERLSRSAAVSPSVKLKDEEEFSFTCPTSSF